MHPPNIPSHVYYVRILAVRSDSYYVHFYAFDRRLDDWYPRNAFITNLSESMREYLSTRDVYHRRAHYNDECEFKEEQLQTHLKNTKIKNFRSIVIGKYSVKAWYFSPVPVEYRTSPILHFCDFCLCFFGRKCEFEYHMDRCPVSHPPGNEIYRSTEQNITISVFEVDGSRQSIYCQNVSYLAKFFLDHKTLEFDTTSFFFYIITERSANGCHFLSYFSKEKNPESEKNFNLSCIMALPCHQRKGLGHFMISLSYGLSKIEKKCGTPETPLSDLGLITYRKFWASELLKIIKNNSNVTISQLAKLTSFQVEDIWFTLTDLGVLKENNVIVINQEICDKFIKKKKIIKNKTDQFVNIVQQERIHWTPHYFKPNPEHARLSH